ncbi:hypothetical protein M3693_19170, partial [Cellulosimicrobium funkei]|nr:hypothetical protein [Cellulosimicrobium funkei]
MAQQRADLPQRAFVGRSGARDSGRRSAAMRVRGTAASSFARAGRLRDAHAGATIDVHPDISAAAHDRLHTSTPRSTRVECAAAVPARRSSNPVTPSPVHHHDCIFFRTRARHRHRT